MMASSHRIPDEQPQQQQKQQILVRFQDRTWIVRPPISSNWFAFTGTASSCKNIENYNNNSDDINYIIRQQISNWTGWSVERLVLTNFVIEHPLWLASCSISVKSSIRGGKGGFGTLLKGQSRQAGAKATTNFAACRDLQGRRLQHVNDTLKYNVWKEWNDKVEAGTATEEQMVEALLLGTSSGISGWHLQLPAWADVSSKQEMQKNKRIFYLWKRQMKQTKERKQFQHELHRSQIDSYVQLADDITYQVSSSVSDALRKGLQKQKQQQQQQKQQMQRDAQEQQPQQPRKRKLQDDHENDVKRQSDIQGASSENILPDPPSSLLTISGEIVAQYISAPGMECSKLQLQSKSNFATVVLLVDRTKINNIHTNESSCDSSKTPYYYYEVGLVTDGIVQIGWSVPEKFQPQSETGDGVGDCANSWSIDYRRRTKLHNGSSTPYDSTNIVTDITGESKIASASEITALTSQATVTASSTTAATTKTNNEAMIVIGCLWNYLTGELSFFVNGVDWGIAFEIPIFANGVVGSADSSNYNTVPNESKPSGDTSKEYFQPYVLPEQNSTTDESIIFPAISCNENEIVELRLFDSQFQYKPSFMEIIPIGVVIATDDKDESVEGSLNPLLDSIDNNDTSNVEIGQSTTDNATSIPLHDASNEKIEYSEQVSSPLVAPSNAPVVIEKLDLNDYESVEQLELLGLDRLKGALMAIGVKCGGTLQERATRLYSLKGLEPAKYPPKLVAKKEGAKSR
jgi:Replication stress response SDE2 C-terminal/Silencing defective 2 N-terminal ubiquitin domain/SPRY domain